MKYKVFRGEGDGSLPLCGVQEGGGGGSAAGSDTVTGAVGTRLGRGVRGRRILKPAWISLFFVPRICDHVLVSIYDTYVLFYFPDVSGQDYDLSRMYFLLLDSLL